MKFIYTFFLLLIFEKSLEKHARLQRNKRHLVFPILGVFKLVIGIAVPINVGIRQSLVCGVNFQFQYALPTNITQLEKPYPPILARERQRRSSRSYKQRNLFYLAVESVLKSHGFDGRQCILRFICDNAMHPLYHSSNGLYGELIHVALTPLNGINKIKDSSPYADAQRAGEFGVDCASMYPDCSSSIMDIISILDN